MKTAMGVFGWTPEVFWNSTMSEFIAAQDGWTELKYAEQGKEPPMTAAEVAEMKEEFEEMKRRFPDVKAEPDGDA